MSASSPHCVSLSTEPPRRPPRQARVSQRRIQPLWRRPASRRRDWVLPAWTWASCRDEPVRSSVQVTSQADSECCDKLIHRKNPDLPARAPTWTPRGEWYPPGDRGGAMEAPIGPGAGPPAARGANLSPPRIGVTENQGRGPLATRASRSGSQRGSPAPQLVLSLSSEAATSELLHLARAATPLGLRLMMTPSHSSPRSPSAGSISPQQGNLKGLPRRLRRRESEEAAAERSPSKTEATDAEPVRTEGAVPSVASVFGRGPGSRAATRGPTLAARLCRGLLPIGFTANPKWRWHTRSVSNGPLKSAEVRSRARAKAAAAEPGRGCKSRGFVTTELMCGRYGCPAGKAWPSGGLPDLLWQQDELWQIDHPPDHLRLSDHRSSRLPQPSSE
ncbi:hypothetical protein C7M84_000578 [Penaeus vannamei]|uniref:Uncharacterized protein n=1 Tax=Penaeus vannamei TaxID=6689 RepID=A0A3R7PRY1_PENVA|nr:hypothetical protein C7M84_000578 [Penaeus vannamei]